MPIQKKWMLPLLGLLAAAGTCFAQAPPPEKHYKLDFTVKELEGGKTVNARAYSTIIPVFQPGGDSGQATIRTGNRVPYKDGAGTTQYMDVGVSIDCSRLRESAGDVSLYLTADISSPLQEQGMPAPVIRQNRWSSNVVVPVKKPTVIFSSDDASSKRQMQLELTATPITR